MDGQDRNKFEPLTDVKPKANANEEINLKEAEPDEEPAYLDDEKSGAPAQPASTANYAQYSQPEKPARSWKMPVVVALIVIAAGAAAYWFLIKSKPASNTTGQSQANTTTNSQASSSSTSAPAAAATTIASTTKNYTSTNFNLSFDYPDDWTVTDNGGGILTVKSPTLSLKNAAGQSVNGQIVLTIRNKSQKLTEFNSGNATATRDSIKIAYAKPTQTQRGNTYVSFLQYATTTAAGGLDGVYITGDSGYLKGQAIPLTDVSKVDPDVAITFIDGNSKALTIADSQWSDTNFATPLTKLLESLSIN